MTHVSWSHGRAAVSSGVDTASPASEQSPEGRGSTWGGGEGGGVREERRDSALLLHATINHLISIVKCMVMCMQCTNAEHVVY